MELSFVSFLSVQQPLEFENSCFPGVIILSASSHTLDIARYACVLKYLFGWSDGLARPTVRTS